MKTKQQKFFDQYGFIIFCCIIAILFNISMMVLIKPENPALMNIYGPPKTSNSDLMITMFTFFLASMGFWVPHKWITDEIVEEKT